VYLAQEDSYATFGSFDLHVLGNTIRYANLIGSHDGMLLYSGSPTLSNVSRSFGTVSHRVSRVTIRGNVVTNTSKGIGNGHGIEVRSSVDTGEAGGNTLAGNVAPQLVCDGTNFKCPTQLKADDEGTSSRGR
jgi:hypothetical protein